MLAFEIKSQLTLCLWSMYYGMPVQAVHGRDCQNTEDRSSSWDYQNTAIVVGEFAVDLRQYNYPRKLLQRFVRVRDYCLCLVFVWTAVLAQLLTPHIG